MFKYLELKRELRDMTEERDYLQIRVNVLEQQMSERNQTYREKIGEKEELREKCNLLDRALNQKNKLLQEIEEIAENNDYGRPGNKVKKILELIKNQNTDKF